MPRGQGGAVESSLVLGEVLTAVVTPFDASGAVDHDRFRELAGYLVDNGSDGLVVAGTTGEAPTLSDDERLALIGTAVEAVGDRATVIAGDRHVLDRALGASDRAGARARRGRPPRRDPVLQQAAAARHRRALQGGRRRERQADRGLQHPGARRAQPGDGDDRAAGRDPERPRRKAGERRPRAGASDRRARARPLRGRRRPDPAVRRARRNRRDLRAHARRRAAGEGARHERARRATTRELAGSSRRPRPRSRSSRCRRTRSRSRPR